MARPSKLTDEVEAQICKAIRAGNDITVAARYARVHPSTFHSWMQKGDPAGTERRHARYRRFRENVDQARAQSEVRFATNIAKCGERQWRAMAYLLERRFPERWGKRALPPTDAEPRGGPEPPASSGWPPGFDHTRLSPQDQERLLELVNRGFDPDGVDRDVEGDARAQSATEWVDPREGLWSSVLMERTLQDPALIKCSHRLLELEWRKDEGEDVDPDAAYEEWVKAAGMPPRPWDSSSSEPDP